MNDKFDVLKKSINELAARWIADGRLVRASVDFGPAILWWRNKGDVWTFAVADKDRAATGTPLSQAPLVFRLQAIKAIPELSAEIDKLLLSREQEIDEAQAVLDELLEDK